MLGVSWLYHGTNCGKSVSIYLGLIQREKCDVKRIVTVLGALLVHLIFDVKNLVSVGTDNASLMVGIKNCVYTKYIRYMQEKCCFIKHDKMCWSLTTGSVLC